VWVVGTVTGRSSIVAANEGADCGGVVRSRGHNIGGDGTCFRGATDLRRARPKLAPLADNGGPVWTMAVPSGSPALNAGFAAGASCGGVDARGVPRPAGSRCDVGAYERVTCMGVTVDHVGTPGNDRLTGTPGRDGFLTFDGDDALDGGDGDDAFCAGDGSDAITASSGDDVVRGGSGGDRLLGGGGDDELDGERGRDRIDGGSGRDSCSGGPGRDALANCST
jgi:Ca2+-binding RTX toxin-like protein